MAYDNNSFGTRQMVDVSAMGLTCAGCSAAITELPFQPSSDRPVYCRDCNRNRRQESRPAMSGGAGAPRPMVDVSSMGLTCAGCSAAITELPFQPSSDRPVYCRDCNRNRRQGRSF